MAYNRQRNVKDGETLVKEGGGDVTKGFLFHGEDVNGKARVPQIETDGSLKTTPSPAPLPPIAGTSNRVRFFGGCFGSSGLIQAGDVSAQMNIDGSVTQKKFYVESQTDYDIHIMQILIVIVDGTPGISHDKFGSISALINGFNLEVYESGESTDIILNAKTNAQMISQAGFSNSFGTGAEAFELINWSNTEDAQIISMDFNKWIPFGLRLGRGTSDEIRAFVNDDLTSLTAFDIRLFGFKNYPEE